MFKGLLSNSFNHRTGSIKDFSGGSDRKESACDVGDLGSIPELGRYSGEQHGNTYQYSCLNIPWIEDSGDLPSMGMQRVGHN